MSKTKQEKLTELYENAVNAIIEYNKEASNQNHLSRLAYLYKSVSDCDDFEDDEEADEYCTDGRYYGPIKAPYARSWFPSMMCYND